MSTMYNLEVERILEENNALWMYPGEPRKRVPHALLTSGLHSNGFATPGPLLKANPDICRRFAEMICDVLAGLPAVPQIDRVVGADTSSTPLAVEIALILDAEPIRMQKQEVDGTKQQIWSPENTALQDGESILHVEELVTTALSSNLVRAGIAAASNGASYRFVPYIPVVVNRSVPQIEWLDAACRFVSLLDLKIENFKPGPDTCPYCRAGSEAIPPKEGDNWELLMQAA